MYSSSGIRNNSASEGKLFSDKSPFDFGFFLTAFDAIAAALGAAAAGVAAFVEGVFLEGMETLAGVEVLAGELALIGVTFLVATSGIGLGGAVFLAAAPLVATDFDALVA